MHAASRLARHWPARHLARTQLAPADRAGALPVDNQQWTRAHVGVGCTWLLTTNPPYVTTCVYKEVAASSLLPPSPLALPAPSSPAHGMERCQGAPHLRLGTM